MTSNARVQWQEQLVSALAGQLSAEDVLRFAARMPTSYVERTTPAQAALDVMHLGALGAMRTAGARHGAFGEHHRLSLTASADGTEGRFRIRRYGTTPIVLTELLPVLESFGLVVEEALPYLVSPGTLRDTAAHIDDIGVSCATRLDIDGDGTRLIDALEAADEGASEIDSLNRLVIAAWLRWPQVTVLRAYRRYVSQCGAGFTDAEMDGALVRHPELARGLVRYFETRFDPRQRDDPESARGGCVKALDQVPHLRQDQILRGFVDLIDATLRTDYFTKRSASRAGSQVTIKLDGSRVPVRAPRFALEAFVYSPEMEGIHLRAGPIARGGIRWSERANYRAEVADLAFAQVKKNAIIVPTGAKGGFFCRSAKLDATQLQAAYSSFVEALLGVTDDLRRGVVVSPEGVRSWDPPDPYLVVAADKGTASYSDLANAIALKRGYWLGDAFASGGSKGYDHKAMGITARGAWIAACRHFEHLGIDPCSEAIRVVGVGDMSGDVFGNGMLLSESMCLVAAFDHRHIFIDPDPDPEMSFAERRRLARLDHSTWADYRLERISRGGGVWSRQDKAVALSEQARRALGVDASELSPPELIKAILGARVDLLYFGGIGTYVKAPEEADSDLADAQNDAVRISADMVRARVVVEGANLGFTQKARIKYSRRGGRINTDFVDNAAGVATSDREVNLKILLAQAVEQNLLDPGARDELLMSCELDVASAVLRQVGRSVAALDRAVVVSAGDLDAYAALLVTLEGSCHLDRDAESLPSLEELEVRREAGAGLIRPELAVFAAYAISDLARSFEQAPWLSDSALRAVAVSYFPQAVSERYGELVLAHRLYPQLVATEVAVEIVERMGITWAHETAAELGRDLADIGGAYWASRQLVGAGRLWDELDDRRSEIGVEAEAHLHLMLTKAVDRLARTALLVHPVIAVDTMIAQYTAHLEAVEQVGLDMATGAIGDEMVALGVEPELAKRYVRASMAAQVADCAVVASRSNRPAVDAMTALQCVRHTLGMVPLEAALLSTASHDRFTAWQLHALRDDLTEWYRAVAVEALAQPTAATDAVARWSEEHRARLSNATALLGSLGRDGGTQLALVTIVVRRLRQFLQSPGTMSSSYIPPIG